MMSSGLVSHLTRVLGASGAREFVDDCSFFESSAGAAGSVDIIGSAIPKEMTKRMRRRLGFILHFGGFWRRFAGVEKSIQSLVLWSFWSLV
jgi:hypothetical protein